MGWVAGNPSFITLLLFSLLPSKRRPGSRVETLAQELATQNGRNLLLASQLFSTTLPTVQEEMGWGERIESVETWDDQHFTLLATIAINGFYLVSTSHVLIPSLTLLTQAILVTQKSQATSRGLTNNADDVIHWLLWPHE
jgi:hypothetical protein